LWEGRIGRKGHIKVGVELVELNGKSQPKLKRIKRRPQKKQPVKTNGGKKQKN